ncbi:hypothetical protein H310_02175 [Aphanomyces invadans]|uniref:Exportin-T n=1 Tax=Aphanomyces invadans TaxID=157072 RepID=A0A024UQ05_9STRA|nr:hypothetical protein H310_02175 [Aphanomyces invadans]ETW07728.1 hypothetical protein H310_02175 [Aphanomyces invadans]|eukprot:XP_008863821.1 hypothetical protein H310_02175 [Aphanomyces invadans]
MATTHQEVNVADLERAVLYAFQYAGASLNDVNAQKVKAEAEMYCLAAKQTSYQFFLQLFQASTHDQVKFYSLQALQEYLTEGSPFHAQLTYNMSLHIRTELVAWLQVQDHLPSFLKTKLAVVIALLIRHDYPDAWGSAFHDLLALLPRGPFMVEMYFCILNATYEEIVEFDSTRYGAEYASHNMKIKDAMRDGPSSCIAQSFDVIYNVLTAYDRSNTHLLALSLAALETLQKYIQWVDIGLVMRFVPLLYHTLQHFDALRCRAANCINQVVAKGMLPDKKLALYTSLEIVPVLTALQPVLNEDADVCEEIGEVVNTMGLELITCIDSFRQTNDRERYQQASAMLASLMPITWFLFAHDTTDVSQEVFEIVNALTGLLRSENPQDAFQPSQYLSSWLHGIYRQMRYPDEEDQVDDAEFEDYRRQLRAIYVNVTRMRPDVILQYIGTLLDEALQTLNSIEHRDLEACLALVYFFKEGLTGAKDLQQYEDPQGPFMQLVVAVHKAFLSHPNLPSFHYRTLCMYYELTTRYSPLLRVDANLLLRLLECIFGSAGVSHHHPTVRSRSCYLVLRLLKSLGTAVHPHMSQLLQALEPHLVVPCTQESAAAAMANGLTLDDQLYLFELTGFLIGSMPTDQTGPLKWQYVEIVLTPQLAQIDQCLRQPSSVEISTHLANILNAMCHVLKGFKTRQSQDIFTTTLSATASVLLAYPTSDSVRSKVIVTLHRLVILLDPVVFLSRADVLTILMQFCEANDVVEVVQLMNQLIIQYKAVPEFFGVLDRTAMPFLQHVVELIVSDQTNATEKATAQKYLYAFLMNIVQHRLTGVLGSPTNASSLPQVFRLILDGFHLELHIIRAVATFCQNLVEHLFKENTTVLSEHRDLVRVFVLQDVLPLMFQVVHTKEFNARDAQSLIVVRDVVKLQVAIYGSSLRDDFLGALHAYFAAINMPTQLAEDYCDSVRSEDVSAIVTKYAAFVQS